MTDLKAREAQLRERLAELDGRLQRIEAHLDAPANPDWEDNAIESEADEVVEELGHVGLAEIDAIRAALARIRNGTYGLCVRCGNAISEARLDLLPHTPLCETCVRQVSRKR